MKSRRCFDIKKMFGLEYIQGYTAALLDVRAVLDDIEYDLKIHKRRQNLKTIRQIIDCMIANRIVLRENPEAFVRCNDNADGGFEIYIEGHGKYEKTCD